MPRGYTDPPAIKALKSSLRGCTEPSLRDRLIVAIRGLERLYNRPTAPIPQDDGDMKRRRFCDAPHRLGLSPKSSKRIAPIDPEIIDKDFDR